MAEHLRSKALVVKAAICRSFGKAVFSRELADLQGMCPVLDGTCSDLNWLLEKPVRR